jgi:hyperosmotically inducible periplasmic protein
MREGTLMNGSPKMMRKLVTSLAGLALLFTSLNVHANTSLKPKVESVERDSVSRRVLRNLRNLPWYGVFDNLEYQVNGDEVILSGQVVNSITKHDAERAVKQIEGVRVVNNIKVLPTSIFDDQIRQAEFRSIYQSPLSRYALGPVAQIHIIVNGGHVTLEGTVANETDRNIAGIRANSVSGVFSVTNNLQVG